MVFGAVQVRVRVLVVEVVRILGMVVFVLVVRRVARDAMMARTVGVAVRVLMTDVIRIVGMAVLVIGVLRLRHTVSIYTYVRG